MHSEGHNVAEPQMCIKGCGFFGNSATENMCSKCYKDHLLKLKATATPTATIESAQTTQVEIAGDGGESKPKATQCFSCRKRVGLTGFACRCGNTYCGLHRYAEEHECSFDYKTHGRDFLAKANPHVKASKIDKIEGPK